MLLLRQVSISRGLRSLSKGNSRCFVFSRKGDHGSGEVGARAFVRGAGSTLYLHATWEGCVY